MPEIVPYIDRHIVEPRLNAMLKSFYQSGRLNEQLLCVCILIELKHDLIELSNLIDTLDELEKKGLDINFKQFTRHRAKFHSEEHIGVKPRYARVVDGDTFKNYIGSWKHKDPEVDDLMEIDPGKIEDNAWSSGNDIVWITPKQDIDRIWARCKTDEDSASMICDHLGFPRDEGDRKYVKIDYSPHFDEQTFQPNSSNRLWHYEYNLFVPFKKLDRFGRTFNQNQVDIAKEQVHVRTTFYDNEFSAVFLGTSSEQHPVNDRIIVEAKKRLDP